MGEQAAEMMTLWNCLTRPQRAALLRLVEAIIDGDGGEPDAQNEETLDLHANDTTSVNA